MLNTLPLDSTVPMNPVIECAERIMLEHPHPALRLTELHELLVYCGYAANLYLSIISAAAL